MNQRLGTLGLVCILWSTATIAFASTAVAAEPALNLVFACRWDNDLYRLLNAGGREYPRYSDPADAVRAASDGAAVLILAEGYPEKTTVVGPATFAAAAKKGLRLYVEYPAVLPDLPVCAPQPINSSAAWSLPRFLASGCGRCGLSPSTIAATCRWWPRIRIW